MTDISKYKNVSLAKETYQKLDKIRRIIVPNTIVSQKLLFNSYNPYSFRARTPIGAKAPGLPFRVTASRTEASARHYMDVGPFHSFSIGYCGTFVNYKSNRVRVYL